ncbi:MAG: FAD:protein FMN transferase, partial [Oscillospiraceae bacterium]|nr:FAD:protein FMN transferase [Oscillospiraceae bacterium]
MDTYIQITAYGKNADKFLLAVNEETVRLEGIFSAHKQESELFALNSRKDAYSEELVSLVSEAIALSELTEGAFDPTLLPVSNLWNFGGGARIPSEEEISDALKHCGYEKISLTHNGIDLGKTELDLGGIAKGYAADRFIFLAKENSIESAMGSFGGMVAVVGSKPNGDPWKIAIRDPKGNGFAAILNVSDLCISTSGAYERYFTFEGKVYHHILDPKTGYPAESDLLSATVINESGTKADALSTALFVMGESKAVDFCEENGICAVLITKDNRIVSLCGA